MSASAGRPPLPHPQALNATMNEAFNVSICPGIVSNVNLILDGTEKSPFVFQNMTAFFVVVVVVVACLIVWLAAFCGDGGGVVVVMVALTSFSSLTSSRSSDFSHSLTCRACWRSLSACSRRSPPWCPWSSHSPARSPAVWSQSCLAGTPGTARNQRAATTRHS